MEILNSFWCFLTSGISEAAENPYGEDDSKSPFPVQPQVKRSYAQNVTVWIKASGLQVQQNPQIGVMEIWHQLISCQLVHSSKDII